MAGRVALARDYSKRVCEILELDPMKTGRITLHFDPQDFVWAEVKLLPTPDQLDRLIEMVAREREVKK